MPLQATSGAASYDAFGGGAAAVPTYIEDVMSTYVYTGTGATQTITNGIDTTTYGGLVWTKARYLGISHRLVDTARGATYEMSSDTTDASSVNSTGLTSFGTTGYTIGSAGGYNNSGGTYVSWTFRKQPKFFDVVTYTGTGSARTIAHSLGSVPGCIIVKITNAAGYDWIVYHRSTGNTNRLLLNDTVPAASGTSFWNDTTPTSTVFSVGNNVNVNQSGSTYVAYLFAHDAGGFGLTGTDNVISCGSFTTDGSGNATVSLGYEPQWVMVKRYDTAQDWYMMDVMRGMNVSGTGKALSPNTADAEITFGNPTPTATGFQWVGGQASAPLIYIAIRRGPMKVPTLGTSVYQAVTRAGTGAVATISSLGFPTDFTLIKTRTASLGYDWNLYDRLRGAKQRLATNSTSTESTETNGLQNYALMNGYGIGASNEINSTSDNFVDYNFRRAPGFFDEVCYTGNGTYAARNHNLTVAPELSITKQRDGSFFYWTVIYATSSTMGNYLSLNRTDAAGSWGSTGFTATQFGLADDTNTKTYVTYLFATCPGVSKVGSYTGNGTTQTINCGFTAGARFVMVKATSTTGNWIVADSARGIVAGNDPALYLNSTAAEVTGLDWIDADNSGFVVNETATIAANTNGVSYIFLAIA